MSHPLREGLLGPRVVSPHPQGLQGSHLNLSQTSAQRHRRYFLLNNRAGNQVRVKPLRGFAYGPVEEFKFAGLWKTGRAVRRGLARDKGGEWTAADASHGWQRP